DVVGHNLANSQTSGYKSRQAEFSSLLYQQINHMADPENNEGRITPDGVRVGSDAKLGSTNADLSLDTIKNTNCLKLLCSKKKTYTSKLKLERKKRNRSHANETRRQNSCR